jgi:AraC-like DNA-binding protein
MTAMVRAAGRKGHAALMASLGVDPLPLLKRHGLPPEAADREDDLLPLRALVNLLEESAAATGCPDFGLRLAASQGIQVLGPLAAAIQHSATAGEALKTAARYLFVQSPALSLTVIEPSSLVADAVELRVAITLPNLSSSRQVMDQCLGDLHRIILFLVRRHYGLRAVTLPHLALADLSVYTRFFGAPVYPEQEHGGLHVTPATLSTSVAEANTSLREIALSYLNQHYADPGLTMTARVQRALRATLGSTRGSKAAIADLLFLHPRTLQRKLALEGAKFEDIRDEVRQQTALRLLRETRMPLTQVAGVLGLSEQSVLTRSCLRWFGQTPSVLRNSRTA